MNTSRRVNADAPLRIVVWSLATAVALVAFAPHWLLLEPRELAGMVALFVYLPLAIGATLWTAASLRPNLGVVIEDAFGHRSDLANAASGTSMTTFTLFGLAFAVLIAPTGLGDGDGFWPVLSSRFGWLSVALGIASLKLTVRSVRRRSEREVHRRVVARARAEVEKDLNETLAQRPPRAPAAPSAW